MKLNPEQLRVEAKRILLSFAFDCIDGGAEGKLTAHWPGDCDTLSDLQPEVLQAK